MRTSLYFTFWDEADNRVPSLLLLSENLSGGHIIVLTLDQLHTQAVQVAKWQRKSTFNSLLCANDTKMHFSRKMLSGALSRAP